MVIGAIMGLFGGGGLFPQSSASELGLKSRASQDYDLLIATKGVQAIPNNAQTDVVWDTIQTITNPKMFTAGGNQIIIQKDGLYYIGVTLEWSTRTDMSHRRLIVKTSNGEPAITTTLNNGASNFVIFQAASAIELLKAGQTVEIDVTHGSGSDLNILSANNQLTILQISERSI